MSNPLYGPELKGMILEKDAEGLRAACENMHPATLAETFEDFTGDEIWEVISPSDIRTQAAIFEYLPHQQQLALVNETHRPQLGALIGKMSHDDRVDLIQRLPETTKDRLLRAVNEADRRDMATLFTYEKDTVGSIMTTDYAWLPPTLTAAEAVDQLRTIAPDSETIYYIYILAEPVRLVSGSVAPRKLLGVISLRDLILASRHTLIRDLMETKLVSLKIDDPQRSAAELLARYDFIAAPVVDENGGMVGIVTHDDVLDVIQDEATQDMQRQGGVSPIVGDYLEASFRQVWYSRAVWLGILFLAQMITINVMGHYESEMKAIAVLNLFVPLCLSVGGNAGSQAATLVTRALALDQITTRDWFRVLRRELLMGLTLAGTLGFLALIRTWLLTNSAWLDSSDPTSQLIKLTWLMGFSVTCICLWGTLLGAMMPIFFKSIGVDPALTSSPFIATMSDVSGIIIYFNIAAFYFF
jgi:magnesium transporter